MTLTALAEMRPAMLGGLEPWVRVALASEAA